MRGGHSKIVAACAALIIVSLVVIRIGIHRREEGPGEEKPAHPCKIFKKDGKVIVALSEAALEDNGIVSSPITPYSYQKLLKVYGIVSDPAPLLALRKDYFSTREKRGKRPARAVDRRFIEKELSARRQWGDCLISALEENPTLLTRLAEKKVSLIQVSLRYGLEMPSARTFAKVHTPDGAIVDATPDSCNSNSTSGKSSATSEYIFLAPLPESCALPGAFLTIDVPEGLERPGFIIPESAVVWHEGRAWVYLNLDNNRYSRSAISTNYPVTGGWFVPEGLKTGQNVVTDGAQLLLSAEFLSQYKIIEIAE